MTKVLVALVFWSLALIGDALAGELPTFAWLSLPAPQTNCDVDNPTCSFSQNYLPTGIEVSCSVHDSFCRFSLGERYGFAPGGKFILTGPTSESVAMSADVVIQYDGPPPPRPHLTVALWEDATPTPQIVHGFGGENVNSTTYSFTLKRNTVYILEFSWSLDTRGFLPNTVVTGGAQITFAAKAQLPAEPCAEIFARGVTWRAEGPSMTASFTPEGLTLDQVEAQCGYDHFNWFQLVMHDPYPPQDVQGHVLSVPYVDPPPGGGPAFGGFADDRLFYWDETGPSHTGFTLAEHTTATALLFVDWPEEWLLQPGEFLSFTTALAGVRADGSWDMLYALRWRSDKSGVSGASIRRGAGVDHGGTGGVFGVLPDLTPQYLSSTEKRALARAGAANLPRDTVGFYRPGTNTFHLRNTNSAGPPDLIIPFGASGDLPVVGDWDGNGTTTIGVYRPSTKTFYLRNTNTPGSPDLIIPFGASGDLPVVGDWDGNGTTTIGVYRPSTKTFYLRNANTSGPADLIVPFDAEGDLPVVGDWDGNGTTTVGLYQLSTNTFYLRNANTAGSPDLTIPFGVPDDLPVVGDWNWDGATTIGVYRRGTNTFHLRNANTAGPADLIIPFGGPGDLPVVGDWDGLVYAISSALLITPSLVDFGAVAVNATMDRTFRVQNLGTGIVTGAAAASEGAFSVVAGTTFSVAPGTSQTVTVRFGPTSGGTFKGEVNFVFDAGTFTRSVSGLGQTFTDVPVSDPFWAWTEALVRAAITAGCSLNPPQYCPGEPVTRSQMAVFLLRGIYGGGHTPPSPSGVFSDVPPNHLFIAWVEQLFADGITSGCGTNPLVYCPDASVTRGQMAVFLLRAIHGAGYQPPAATGMFADVPLDHLFVRWIEQLAREGITGGCATSPARYCPEDPVTRGQMAAFLVRAFGLSL